jgi:hypothetical protein
MFNINIQDFFHINLNNLIIFLILFCIKRFKKQNFTIYIYFYKDFILQFLFFQLNYMNYLFCHSNNPCLPE